MRTTRVRKHKVYAVITQPFNSTDTSVTIKLHKSRVGAEAHLLRLKVDLLCEILESTDNAQDYAYEELKHRVEALCRYADRNYAMSCIPNIQTKLDYVWYAIVQTDILHEYDDYYIQELTY